MKLRIVWLAAVCGFAILAPGCKPRQPTTTASPGSSTAPLSASKAAGPLPDSGFKAQITVPDPPAKLRAGQKEVITVKIKNASNVVWWQGGGETNGRADNKFYIAVGNHWLDKDGK